MQKNPCRVDDPLQNPIDRETYEDAVSLEDGIYPITTDDSTIISSDMVKHGNETVEDALDGLTERNYSSEERKVGRWVDGSDLYEKTVSCGALPNNSSTTIPHGISNINKIIAIEGIAFGTGSAIPIPYANGSTTACAYATTTNIYVQTKADLTSYTNSYVTLRYTKTA